MKWQKLLLTFVVVAAIPFGSGRAMESHSEISAAALAANSQDTTLITILRQNSAPERIQFAPGATSAVVSGNLPAKHTARYVLRALAGQLMEVTLSAPEGARLSVTTAAGRALTPITASSTAFRGYLPGNGNYIIKVASDKQAVSYSVNISIPQRIAFERGATSAALEGHVDAHQSHDYILRASAGQLMEIVVTPENSKNSLQLIIYGVDGTVLRSGMGEESSFRGELPLGEDYLVSVRAGDQNASFIMKVIIPQRITFQRGAVSAAVKGTVSANHRQYYVLRALKDQTMQVEIIPDHDVQLIIYGADGTVLKGRTGEGGSFRGKLPGTEDYILAVRAGRNAAAYTLRVIIR